MTRNSHRDEPVSPCESGAHLADLIARAPLDDAMLYALARELAESLAHAHDRGHVVGPIRADAVIRQEDGRCKFASATGAKPNATTRADDLLAYGQLLVDVSRRNGVPSLPAWLARVVERCHPAHASPFRRGADVVAALLPHAFRFSAKHDDAHSAPSEEFSDDTSVTPIPMRRAALLCATLTTVIGIAAIVVRDDAPPAEVDPPHVRATPERTSTPKKKKVKERATVVDATPDTTAPVVTFTAIDGSPLESRFAVDGASFVFTMAATDDRGVESATQRVRSPSGDIRTEAVSPMSLRRGTSVEIPLPASGEYTIELDVVDGAGNAATAQLVIERR